MGNTRRRELVRAAASLGLQVGAVTILDHPQMQDGWVDWDKKVVAQEIETYLNDNRMDVVRYTVVVRSTLSSLG